MATASRMTADEARAITGRAAADPEWFATTILGHDLWPTQRAILRALARPRARVAVKACHSSSKTYTAAEAVLWWVCSGGIAVTTAPTWLQVEELLWGEIRRAHEAARFPLGGTLLKTQLRFTPDCFAIGLSTNEGVRFQGWHGRVLLVFDEAPGVAGTIWEAAEGVAAGGDVRLLAVGNPVETGGPFYDAFARSGSGWVTITIDALDTPNLVGLGPTAEERLARLVALPEDSPELDVAPRPYLVTRRWVRERHADWGEESPIWQARVRGQFPTNDEQAVIPLAWVEAAVRRWQEWDAAGRPGADTLTAVGADIGRTSDKTAFALRSGNVITELRRWGKADTMATAGRLVGLLSAHPLAYAVVDVIGIGAGVVDALRQEGLDARTVAFNASAAARWSDGQDMLDRSGELGFINRRAAAWWHLRELLDPRNGEAIALPPDERLRGDLVAPRWRPVSQGRIQIEAKEDLVKRLGRSTDDGDAVVMAFERPDTTPTLQSGPAPTLYPGSRPQPSRSAPRGRYSN